MDKVLNHLRKALSEIKKGYYQRNERDFSYELYHQCRVLARIDDVEVTCETPKGFSFPQSLRKNGIVTKYFHHEQNIDWKTRRFRRTPDLLYHHYDNRDHQLLAMEIKPLSTSLLKVKIDIAKLISYCYGKLRYQKGVLLLFADSEEIASVNNLSTAIVSDNEVRELLRTYPNIEIWIKPIDRDLDIYCSSRLR
jgi:hypothetical protein